MFKHSVGRGKSEHRQFCPRALRVVTKLSVPTLRRDNSDAPIDIGGRSARFRSFAYAQTKSAAIAVNGRLQSCFALYQRKTNQCEYTNSYIRNKFVIRWWARGARVDGILRRKSELRLHYCFSIVRRRCHRNNTADHHKKNENTFFMWRRQGWKEVR